jgi:hypothetical protein
LREVEKHATPLGTFRESNRPQRYLGYVALMAQISNAEPAIYDDVAKHVIAQVVGWENPDPTMEQVLQLGNPTPNVTSM